MALKLKTLAGAPANFPLPVIVKDLAGQDVEIGFTGIGRTLRDWHPIYFKRLAEEANTSMETAEKAEAEAEKAEAEAEAAKDAAGTDGGKAKKKKRKPIEYKPDEAEANIEAALQRAVVLIREFAAGWDLDLEFSDENLKSLISQYPGVQQLAHEKYHQAILGNRAKN